MTKHKGPNSYLHEFRTQVSHASLKVSCSRCGSAVDVPCVKPNGQQADQPHGVRVDAARVAGHWGIVSEKF